MQIRTIIIIGVVFVASIAGTVFITKFLTTDREVDSIKSGIRRISDISDEEIRRNVVTTEKIASGIEGVEAGVGYNSRAIENIEEQHKRYTESEQRIKERFRDINNEIESLKRDSVERCGD